MENKCSICGSEKHTHFNKKYNNYLCGKHSGQLFSYGEFLDNVKHSKYDRNEIILQNDYAIIITRNVKYEITGRYIIDLDDVSKIQDIRWRRDKRGYAFNNSGKNIFLHNIILPTSDGYFVDHIDRNPMNSQKENLRAVRHIQNCLNRDILKRNTTGVTGVSYVKSKHKWRSRIHVDTKEVMVYYGSDFQKAIYERVKNEAIYYKEYSRFYNVETGLIEFELLQDNIRMQLCFDLNGEEVSYAELLSIKSERGLGCLGSSNK